MSVAAPQIPVPAGIARAENTGVIDSPPQPHNPPTPKDVALAVLFEHDTLAAYRSRTLTQDKFINVVQYKNAVVAAATENPAGPNNAQPPWFAQAMATALQPLEVRMTAFGNELQTVKANIVEMKADIATIKVDLKDVKDRQAHMQRAVALMHNRTVGPGNATPFLEVPWANGAFPWGYIHHNNPLPQLTSADVVHALGRRESRRYFEGYYPGQEVPEDQPARGSAILAAIGCAQEHADPPA
ncbi:hypothetical protein BKA93DRAFT_813233 [Sparassis latifolia]